METKNYNFVDFWLFLRSLNCVGNSERLREASRICLGKVLICVLHILLAPSLPQLAHIDSLLLSAMLVFCNRLFISQQDVFDVPYLQSDVLILFVSLILTTPLLILINPIHAGKLQLTKLRQLYTVLLLSISSTNQDNRRCNTKYEL